MADIAQHLESSCLADQLLAVAVSHGSQSWVIGHWTTAQLSPADGMSPRFLQLMACHLLIGSHRVPEGIL